MSTPLLKLYKGSYNSDQLSTLCGIEGAIVFDKNTNRIYAGTANETPFMFGSNVEDASFANSVLKIWKKGDAENNPSISLDFSDIASASSMMAVFTSMADKMGLTGQGHDQLDYTGTNYLTNATSLVAADKALDAKIKEAIDGIENLDVAEYAQATVDTTTSQTETTFKVKSIKEVNGKIEAGESTTDIKLDGKYDASDNKIATQTTVSSAITNAINALDSSATVATVNDGVVTINAAIAQEDGQIDTDGTNTIELAKVATTGAAEDVSYNNSESGMSATDVQTAIDELAGAIGDSVVHDVMIGADSIVNGEKVAKISVEGTYHSVDNKIATESTVSDAIEALDTVEDVNILDVDDTYDSNTSTKITFHHISETDGVISRSSGESSIIVDGTYNESTNKIATQSTVTNAINNLGGSATIASVDNNTGVVTIKAGITEENGVVDNNDGDDITLAKVATTGAAEDVSYNNSESGMSATDVQTAIDELDNRLDGLEGSFDVIKSTDAETTPYGVKWMDGSTEITGTLTASDETFHKIYLVPNGQSGKNSYAEYITTKDSSATPTTYAWEKLGDIDIDLTGYAKTVTVNGTSHAVDSNSTNIGLGNIVNAVTGETAISGGESGLVAVTPTDTVTNGVRTTDLDTTVKVEEVADGLTKDSSATYSDGHYVIENGKLVSAVGKSSGDTYTKSANDGLTKASDVKAYVDSAIKDAEFRWSEWS